MKKTLDEKTNNLNSADDRTVSVRTRTRTRTSRTEYDKNRTNRFYNRNNYDTPNLMKFLETKRNANSEETKIQLLELQNKQENYILLITKEYERNIALFEIDNPLNAIEERFKSIDSYYRDYSQIHRETLKYTTLQEILVKFVNTCVEKAKELKLKSYNKLNVQDVNNIIMTSISPLRPKNQRPNVPVEELKTKKIAISFSEKRYDELKAYQDFFKYTTFSGMLEDLLDKGLSKIKSDFEELKK